MTEQEAIEALQDIHDVAECRIKNGDSRGVVYIPEEKLNSFDIAIAALEDIQQYKAIGTPEECRAAVEKQKAMKVTDIHVDEYRCPACGQENTTSDALTVGDHYCPNCGQRLE